jgi:peptide/nickel transport system permease protein
MEDTRLTIEPIPETVPPPQTAVKGESYWDLVLRQFRRNRLAVVSFVFVLLLSLIAIVAPFLANNEPIVLRGAFRGLYKDRFEEWKLGGHPELMEFLRSSPTSAGPEAAAQLRARLATVERQLDYLGSQLPPEQARQLSGYREDYRKAVEGVRAGDAALVAAQMQKLDADFQEISQKFDPAAVQVQQKFYWPVFSHLTPLNVFFLTVAAMLLLLLAARLLLPPGTWAAWRAHWELQFLLILLPSVLLTGYWYTRPAIFDTMDYKQDLFDGRIESSLALFPPIQFGINEGHLGDKYLGPSARYWMGTDGNGRDLLTRMIWGSQISLSVGFVAVAIYVFIGIVVGTVAGYFRGWVDMVLSRLIEIVICFPTFFLILAVLAFLQPTLLNIMVVIGITGWTTEARLVRGEFLRLNDQEFVLAAKGLGVSDARIIFRHILPNGLAPLLVSASFGVASAILIESSLSFLGFGISIPVPSWGGILNEARENFRYWWITIYPGLAIFATVTAYNLVGEAIRDAIDPRLKV